MCFGSRILIFGETGEVDWSAGLPLALGSAAGAYAAARLVTLASARTWVYRFLVLVVVLSIVHLLMVDSTKFLQHTCHNPPRTCYHLCGW